MAKGDMFKKSRSTTRNPMSRGTQMPVEGRAEPRNQGPVRSFGRSAFPAGQSSAYGDYARSFGQNPHDPILSDVTNRALFGPAPTPAQYPSTPVPQAPVFDASGMDRKRIGPLNSFTRPNYQFTGPQRNPVVQGPAPQVFGGGPPMPRNSPLAQNADVRPGVSYLDRTQQNAAMSDLIGKINGLTAQSQIRNPVSAEPTRPGSSMDAGQRAGRIPGLFYSPNTARAANSYGDMNSVTAGQEYARQIPTDMAGMSNRLANQNPMHSGMQQRFAGQLPGLMADQAAVARGEAVNMGGYGEGRTVNFNKTPAQAEQAALAARGRTNPSVRAKYDDPKAKARRADFAADKSAKHDAFKAANGGMNYKQARRAEQSQKRQDSLLRQAIMRGENPMSPRATAMFPEAAGRFRQNMQGGQAKPQMQNPMASAMGPGATNTPESISARRSVREGLVKGVPASENSPGLPPSQTVASMGLTPESGVPDVANAMKSMRESGVDLSASGIREIQAFIRALDTPQGKKSPFDTEGDVFAGLSPDSSPLRYLYEMPEDATDEELLGWWDTYKSYKPTGPVNQAQLPPPGFDTFVGG